MLSEVASEYMLLKMKVINTQKSSPPKYFTTTSTPKVIFVYFYLSTKEPESLKILERFLFMSFAEDYIAQEQSFKRA